MAYVPVRCDTLLIPSGPPQDPDRKHLFVIVTDICADGDHMLVGISTIKVGKFHDPTCLLDAGSHPFITTPSYVEYRYSRRDSARHIANCVDRGFFIQRELIDPAIFEMICAGIEVSPHIPRGLRRYFRDVRR